MDRGDLILICGIRPKEFTFFQYYRYEREVPRWVEKSGLFYTALD